jgi:hypothetical protein
MADLYALQKWRSSTTDGLDMDVAPGSEARLLMVTVKFSAAPTTSENLTVRYNHVDGGEYNPLLMSTDPSDGSVTDVVYIPDAKLLLGANDSITVAYTNTDHRLVAAQVMMEVEA